jgi:hypothetical protein
MRAVGNRDHDARPLLVGLAPAHRHLEALTRLDAVGDVERSELGATEAVAAAEQQQSPVAGGQER